MTTPDEIYMTSSRFLVSGSKYKSRNEMNRFSSCLFLVVGLLINTKLSKERNV